MSEKEPSAISDADVTGRGDSDPTLTRVDGIEVGHAHDLEGLTGCTAVLCRQGAVAAIEIVGSAPGTRQTDSLRPGGLVDRIHGVCLSGGSAFGLQSCDGVTAHLLCGGIGFRVGGRRVPIVPGAVIFDLGVGDGAVFPDLQMGRRAALASSREPVAQGCVGAGCGATVGKLLGTEMACKSGLGSWSVALAEGLQVGALVVVNAFGDVRDPRTGELVAGARTERGSLELADSAQRLRQGLAPARFRRSAHQSTTLAVVATNAELDVLGAKKVAQMAAGAFHTCLSPAATMVDGDLCFCLSTGTQHGEIHQVGLWAREAVEKAILRGVRSARPAGGLPVAGDLSSTVYHK